MKYLKTLLDRSDVIDYSNNEEELQVILQSNKFNL